MVKASENDAYHDHENAEGKKARENRDIATL